MTISEMMRSVAHAHRRLPGGSLYDHNRVQQLATESLKRSHAVFHYTTWWEAQPRLDAHTGERIGWYDVLRGRDQDRHIVPREPVGELGKYSWDQTFDPINDQMRPWDI